MANPRPTAAQTIQIATEAVRDLGNELDRRLLKLGALTTAFQLAAQADEGGGKHALYWPDLVEILAEYMPDHEALNRSFSAITDHLEDVGSDLADASTAPAAASRRGRAEIVAEAAIR